VTPYGPSHGSVSNAVLGLIIKIMTSMIITIIILIIIIIIRRRRRMLIVATPWPNW